MDYKKILKVSTLCVLSTYALSGCSAKNQHEEMISKTKKKINKKTFNSIQKSYTKSIIKTTKVKQTYVNISIDKSLSDILKELEIIEDKIYYFKGKDFIVPKSRIQIDSINTLNDYLIAVLEKKLHIKTKSSLNIVELFGLSKLKKISFENIKFDFEGYIPVNKLGDLITEHSGFEISFDTDITNKKEFDSKIVFIKSKNLIDTIHSLGNSLNLYVDIDYDNEKINIRKYKDLVIELNIPMIQLKTSNEIKTQENSGISQVKNDSEIMIFEELNKMLESISKDDKKINYHIDKSSGLIYLKANKNIEFTVRNIVKAYEDTFSKEATIVFERVELLLNKNMEYGIGSIKETTTDAPNILNQFDGSSSNISLTGQLLKKWNVSSLLNLTAKADNSIGHILNYSKNLIVLKNNIPTMQSLSQNKDYIEKIEPITGTDTGAILSSNVTVNTMKDGSLISALAKINRDKIFLNITPNIKKLVKFHTFNINTNSVELPEYKSQNYNISKEIKLGETVIVGSMIVHDDASDYKSILPIENFAIGGSDTSSYVRREIIYLVTLEYIKGF